MIGIINNTITIKLHSRTWHYRHQCYHNRKSVPLRIWMISINMNNTNYNNIIRSEASREGQKIFQIFVLGNVSQNIRWLGLKMHSERHRKHCSSFQWVKTSFHNKNSRRKLRRISWLQCISTPHDCIVSSGGKRSVLLSFLLLSIVNFKYFNFGTKSVK